jgi:hypothetical protein
VNFFLREASEDDILLLFDWVNDKDVRLNSINQDFKKHFVGTNTYRNSVISITNSINRILKLPNLFRVSDSFHNLKINNILESFKLVDFNDSYINELCIGNKYKVFTNDKDFQKLYSKIDIITTQVN